MGKRGVTAFRFLSEDLYFKTRLQFDETAKYLQSLESATRKAVCAAVKEFNRNQVAPGTPQSPRPKSQAQPFTDSHHTIHMVLPGAALVQIECAPAPAPELGSLGMGGGCGGLV